MATLPTLMFRRSSAALCLVCLAATGHAQVREWVLSDTELAAAKRRAVGGSADDSYRVSQHYFEYETIDFVEHFFYLRLSVEQGSCDGIWEMRKLQKRGPTDAFRLERDWVAFSRSFGCGPPATSLLQRPAHPDASKE